MFFIKLDYVDFMSNIFRLFILYFLFCLLPVFSQSDNITIAGSTTILPISEKWAKVFKEKTGVTVNVHGGGSTGGINATKIGTADIGACSRELNANEKTGLKAIVIGKDALAIIVNKLNPIENITIDQIRGIYTGRIKNWKELGGFDKSIQAVNRESGSGTRELFVETVMKIKLKDNTEKIVPMTLTSVVNNSNAEIKETVKLIPNAIGYLSVGFTDDSVKLLKVNSITASEDNILRGTYSLVRNLYYVVGGYKKENVNNFLGFVLSKEGQGLILKEGFFPVVVAKD